MNRTAILLASTIVLSGCAPKIMVATIAPADVEMARAALEPGTSTIKGSALLRQRGGGVVTCAGNEVFLVPATESTSREMRRIFGAESGMVAKGGDPIMGGSTSVVPPDPNRRAICNAQGFFTFDKVKPMKWFVMTTVLWEVGSGFSTTNQGGTLLAVAEPQEGQETEITLAY